MKYIRSFLLAMLLLPTAVSAQDELSATKADFGKYLTEMAKGKIYTSAVNVEVVKDSAGTLSFYCSETLADVPLRRAEVDDIYSKLKELLPAGYKDRKLKVYTLSHEISEYIPQALEKSRGRKLFTRETGVPGVRNASAPFVPERGLWGRNIVVWPSHGRYYESKLNRWEWQRARMFETVEDLYTRSYVMPFLVPMLEKAGANVYIPRERDTQTEEVIVDNDKGLNDPSSYRETNGREPWKYGDGQGFAWKRKTYSDFENPFTEGTYRCAATTAKADPSSIEWIPDIKKSGEHAVYVSYRTVKGSVDDAEYTVVHRGIKTKFLVNQTMGGGTWLYLGTFDFSCGDSDNNKVILSNVSKQKNGIVTADAVRFGGGMGNIARGLPADSLNGTFKYITSGYPRFTEGARYYLQWAGVPDSVYSPTRGTNDYRDDFTDRGIWVNWLAGGSSVYPDGKGLGIPIDLSMAFHSNAGTFKDDRIFGTLAIYSSKEYNGRFYNGSSRFLSHDLSDLIQTNIVNDIKRSYAPEWRRLGNWNKPYFEAWGPRVPAMLLELLSHQNFADMRYGLDPRFRFTVSRAVYKGMLQFISSMNGTKYTVSPLSPIRLSARFLMPHSNLVTLSWHAQTDSLEPTAKPDAYIIYTRKGDGDFDNGVLVKDSSYTVIIPADTVCSFKVSAVNQGGESFPSEIISAGRSSVSLKNTFEEGKNGRLKSALKKMKNLSAQGEDKLMLIINGFSRICAPASFTAPAPADTAMAGFLDDEDHGVPYLQDFSYIGSQKEFRRSLPWYDDDSGGFGDSYGDYETTVVAGNTFDYPAVHGCSVLRAGWSFVSCGRDAVESGDVSMNDYKYADLILGKQMQTGIGKGGYYPIQFKTFTPALEKAIESFTSAGGSIFTSGSYIASDLWCNPAVPSAKTDRDFLTNVMHYKWRNRRAARTGKVYSVDNPAPEFAGSYEFRTVPNPDMYVVESPDGIEPADAEGFTVMRYTENNLSAGVAWKGKYRTVSLGFPYETIVSPEARDTLMKAVLTFFTKDK